MTAFIEAMMTMIKEPLIAAAALMLAASAEAPQHVQESQSEQKLGRFTDQKHRCTYIIAGADDGLHIVVTGGEHCYRRIKVDGQTIDLGRRI